MALLRFRETGGDVLIEATPLGDEAIRPVGARDVVIDAGKRLSEALACVPNVAQGVIAAIEELSIRPREVEVEFGVKLTTEAGIIVSSAAAEANFRVRLKWSTARSGDGQ
jgi:hypothetical protein